MHFHDPDGDVTQPHCMGLLPDRGSIQVARLGGAPPDDYAQAGREALEAERGGHRYLQALGRSIPGQQATSAAEFQDEPGTHPHRLKQRQDSRRAGLGVEAETAVVNKRQVAAVTDVLTERHAMSVPRIGR